METAILFLFIIGYILIAFEHVVKVNKAAIALLTGVLADWWGISGAILSIGALTIFSALVIQIRYTNY